VPGSLAAKRCFSYLTANPRQHALKLHTRFGDILCQFLGVGIVGALPVRCDRIGIRGISDEHPARSVPALLGLTAASPEPTLIERMADREARVRAGGLRGKRRA